MELLKSNLKTTKYEIERQWCSHCKGEVTGNPIGGHSSFQAWD